MRSVLRVGAASALAAAAVLGSSPAAAHEEGGVLLTAVVRAVTPPVPGLRVAALPSVAPLLEVRNEGGFDVVVLGEHGEPFLRIGPAGVFGNVRSGTLERSADPFAGAPVAVPQAREPVEWRRLHSRPSWRWFDHRLRIDGGTAGKRTPFTVPLRVRRRPVLVRGFVQVGEIGHLRSLLDGAPRVHGLEVRVLQGPVPALFVRNETREILEVPGASGEPFLRIGPGGVRGNIRSPTLHRAGSPVIRPVPPLADAGAEPVWKPLSNRPAWAWLEYRAWVPEEGVRPFALGSRSGTVARWTTPLRLGGDTLALTGHVEWVPAGADASVRRPGAGDAAGGPRVLVPFWAAIAAIAAFLLRARRPGRRSRDGLSG